MFSDRLKDYSTGQANVHTYQSMVFSLRKIGFLLSDIDGDETGVTSWIMVLRWLLIIARGGGSTGAVLVAVAVDGSAGGEGTGLLSSESRGLLRWDSSAVELLRSSDDFLESNCFNLCTHEPLPGIGADISSKSSSCSLGWLLLSMPSELLLRINDDREGSVSSSGGDGGRTGKGNGGISGGKSDCKRRFQSDLLKAEHTRFVPVVISGW